MLADLVARGGDTGDAGMGGGHHLEVVEPAEPQLAGDVEPAALRLNTDNLIGNLFAPLPKLLLLGEERLPTRLKQTTDRAEAAIPALETLLMNEDPGVRARVGSLLPYIAQRHPEAAAPLTSLLIDCLEDELTPIRASVVWTLGYIDTKTARNALREVAGADPDPSLRTLATDRLYAEADD